MLAVPQDSENYASSMRLSGLGPTGPVAPGVFEHAEL